MPTLLERAKPRLRGLLNRIQAAAYTPFTELTVEAWKTPEPVPFAERMTGTPLTLRPGDKWGDLWECAWFHFTGEVLDAAAGRDVVLLIDLNGEALVVDEAGQPALGLTNIASVFDYSLGRPGKRVVPFAHPAKGGERVDLWADAGANDLFGSLQENGTLREATIAVRNPELLALSYDWEVLHELMEQLPDTSARHQQLLGALYEASLTLNAFTEEEAISARAILAPHLAKSGGDPSLTLSAVGHAHIDLAWLWPLRETFRKGARTFATVLANMERYPDYVFGASQPQLYAWMKVMYPALYERIRARIAEGRWECQGAMWVEPDTNVPSGESLVRQLLYGKRFFRTEFGVDITNLWMPDVFGYSAALPQLLRKAGVDAFMTQKLSWSLINRFPHHSFWWQGLDGSRVLSHMPPEDTYNSSAAPRALHKAETNYMDKAVSDECLLVFGIGDGGGGPGEEHLERLAREKNLSGLPAVRQEPAAAFLERLKQAAPRFQTWVGELYLERHQGTYTTQGRNKRFNRKLELALRDLEASAAVAWVETGAPYPAEALERIWKEVLLYQFHDILPGSSITRVYDESLARYAEMLTEVETLTAAADAAWSRRLNASGIAKPVALVNSLSWERRDWVKVGEQWRCVTLPPMGCAVLDAAAPSPAPTGTLSASETALENDLLRVEFGENGELMRVWDKEYAREALAEGETGNRFVIYPDDGDAWDFPMDYDRVEPDTLSLVSSEPFTDGPRVGVRQTRRYGDSTMTQEIRLTAGSRRLDFVTTVDWKEPGKMLRTRFPVSVRADELTCEIQFGHLRRPTHRNTTWDLAKFEVCAQRWVDLSERGYGVALLNDSKYGHRAMSSTLDLHLLRTPSYPDPQADRARHEFTYSLFPHAGDALVGGVVQAGYELNVSPRVVALPSATDAADSKTLAAGSWISVDAENVIVEAVKKAEDGDDLILRLYEAYGADTTATIRFGFEASAAALTDLLEENGEPLALADGGVSLHFRPFEVQTLRVTPAK